MDRSQRCTFGNEVAFDGQPGAGGKTQGGARPHRKGGARFHDHGLQDIERQVGIDGTQRQVAGDLPRQRIAPHLRRHGRVELVEPVVADDGDVVGLAAVEAVELVDFDAGGKLHHRGQGADIGERRFLDIHPPALEADQGRGVVGTPVEAGALRRRRRQGQRHRRRQRAGEQDGHRSDRGCRVAGGVDRGDRGIVARVRLQTGEGVAARGGAEATDGGQTGRGTEVRRLQIDAEGIEVGRRRVVAPLDRRTVHRRAAEHGQRVDRRSDIDIKGEDRSGGHDPAQGVGGGAGVEVVGAAIVRAEGGGRAAELGSGKPFPTRRQHGRGRSIGTCQFEDGQHGGIHRPVEGQREAHIGGGTHRAGIIADNLDDDRLERTAGVMGGEVHHRRIERAEGLVELALVAEVDAIEFPVVEDVLGVAVLNAGAGGEGGGLAVGEGAVTSSDAEPGRLGRRDHLVDRVGLDEDRLQDARSGDAQIEHGLGADLHVVLQPMTEQVALAGGGGELGAGAVGEEAGAGDAAGAGGRDLGTDLVRGQGEFGDELAVGRGREGVVGTGADKDAVLRPTHKLVGQHRGVRHGRHRHRRAGEEGAAATDSATCRIRRRHGDGPVLQDREAGLRAVRLRGGMRDTVVFIHLAQGVGGDGDLVDAGSRRRNLGRACLAGRGSQRPRCAQLVEHHRAGRRVDHAHPFLEAVRRAEIAGVGQIPAETEDIIDRSRDGEVLHDQVRVGRQCHREGGLGGRGVVVFQDDLVHLVGDVRAGDEMVAADRARRQFGGAGHGVRRPHGQPAIAHEDTDLGVIGIAEDKVGRQHQAVAPGTGGDVRRTDIGDREGVREAVAALEIALGRQIHRCDLQVRNRH